MVSYLILFVLLYISVIVVWLFHKSRKIHLLIARLEEGNQKKIDNIFIQIDRLISVYADLNLAGGLPASRGWAVSPDMLSELVSFALNVKPQTVVECGSGVSTIALARCLQKNGMGHVYSLEHEPTFAASTRANLAKHGLSDWGTVIDAPLVEHEIDGKIWHWYETENLPNSVIDMIFVDGPPEPGGPMARYPAGPLLFSRLSVEGTAFIDDANTSDGRENLEAWRRGIQGLRNTPIECEKGGARLMRQSRS